jgi:hypothetical protein
MWEGKAITDADAHDPEYETIVASDEIRSGSLMGLNMLFKVAQNCLPAAALLLNGMCRLSVKRFPHRDAIFAGDELDD